MSVMLVSFMKTEGVLLGLPGLAMTVPSKGKGNRESENKFTEHCMAVSWPLWTNTCPPPPFFLLTGLAKGTLGCLCMSVFFLPRCKI